MNEVEQWKARIKELDAQIHDMTIERHILIQRTKEAESLFKIGDIIRWKKWMGRVVGYEGSCLRVQQICKDGTNGPMRNVFSFDKPELVK